KRVTWRPTGWTAVGRFFAAGALAACDLHLTAQRALELAGRGAEVHLEREALPGVKGQRPRQQVRVAEDRPQVWRGEVDDILEPVWADQAIGLGQHAIAGDDAHISGQPCAGGHNRAADAERDRVFVHDLRDARPAIDVRREVTRACDRAKFVDLDARGTKIADPRGESRFAHLERDA